MKRIDLDANATTPLLPEVLEAMQPFLMGGGNPSAAHAAGQRARAAVERARESVAKMLGATAKEIVFTSGGTEADNLALAGVLQPALDRGERPHLITTQIEHHAVLYAAEALERRGVSVTYVQPSPDGVVDADAVVAAVRPETKLVSVMLANNETGVAQSLGRIGRLVKAAQPGVLVHTDAMQGAGKLAIDLAGEFKNVDLLSISGHKMYAPQGTGALFVRKGVRVAPMLFGGPQERQRRAGTENVAGIVGLGRAAEAAREWFAAGGDETLRALRDEFEAALLEGVSGAQVNGAFASRVPNTANVMFPGVDGEALLIALDMQGVAASFGAACMSGATEPSHVLLAMGLSAAAAKASLRFSLSRLTSPEELVQAAAQIVSCAGRLA